MDPSIGKDFGGERVDLVVRPAGFQVFVLGQPTGEAFISSIEI